MSLPYRSTKTFSNLPCAHRQHRHDGVCAFVHGYSRSFYFLFGATQLDRCGFVVDFGKLKLLKAWLDSNFDHTLLLNADDHLLPLFREVEAQGGARIILPPYGPGMEGSAHWALEAAQGFLDGDHATASRCYVVAVECRENDKNSAIYYNPEAPK